MLLAVSVPAQNVVTWTTNSYPVTGTNFRQIHESIAAARRGSDDFAGETRWSVEWSFRFNQGASHCSCTSVRTATKIVTTLPRWISAAHASQETRERWTKFFVALGQHEAGHAQIGIAAANEVGKIIAAVPPQSDCDQLTKRINESAERVLDEYRRREREYDRVTDHGRRPSGSR